jgi:hypothetical protein
MVGSAGKSSGWVIAGYSVDYGLDWALVVVMGIVLAASEAGVPREGWFPFHSEVGVGMGSVSLPAWQNKWWSRRGVLLRSCTGASWWDCDASI